VILAGDVGGTNTRLARYEGVSRAHAPSREWHGKSGDYRSLTALVAEFLGTGPRPERAAFGVAGPVVDGRCEATNLAWIVDHRDLERDLAIPEVRLVNDLVATAHGLAELDAGDLEPLQDGEPRPGNRALIAAGTGLGEAVLTPSDGRWLALATEGGHTDFAPRDPLEDELNQWLRARYGRVSYERVLSGPGLADLYRFFRDTRRGDEPAEIAMRFDRADQPAAIVTETALDGSCERARLVLDRFVSIYGAEAGNLALKAMALGGVFVGGGIAPRMLPALTRGGFVHAFFEKGRLSPVLTRIPVSVVLDERTALWGAAAYAMIGS
jgi:glucokinase